jgi:hypothetical protein
MLDPHDPRALPMIDVGSITATGGSDDRFPTADQPRRWSM